MVAAPLTCVRRPKPPEGAGSSLELGALGRAFLLPLIGAPLLAATHSGEKVSLADFRSEKTLVLYFYPKDDTPGCTKEACSFRDAYQDFVDAFEYWEITTPEQLAARTKDGTEPGGTAS